MIMSHKTQQKSKNDLEDAQKSSQMTVLLNIFATLIGSIALIICIAHYLS